MEQQKTRDERIAELLDKPAIEAVSAIKGPSLSDLTVEPKEKEQEAPELEEESEETESGGKKVRIPRSRLQTLTKELKELRDKTSYLETASQRIAELEAKVAQSHKSEDDLPEWWREAYGDDEISKKGYQNQQRVFREEMNREFERRENERIAQERQREERIEAIESSFDEQMEALEDSLGRELTANQKSELMDIVGEYSPKEGDNYIAYIPVDKAYDIWQKSQGLSQSKSEMANIASMPSSGNASAQTSSERPQWGDWRKRFGK